MATFWNLVAYLAREKREFRLCVRTFQRWKRLPAIRQLHRLAAQQIESWVARRETAGAWDDWVRHTLDMRLRVASC